MPCVLAGSPPSLPSAILPGRGCLGPCQVLGELEVSRSPQESTHSTGVTWRGVHSLTDCCTPVSAQVVLPGRLALGHPLNVRVTAAKCQGAHSADLPVGTNPDTQPHPHQPCSRCVPGLVQPSPSSLRNATVISGPGPVPCSPATWVGRAGVWVPVQSAPQAAHVQRLGVRPWQVCSPTGRHLN